MSQVVFNFTMDDILDKMVTESAMLKVHQELARVVDPWTPYLSGQLSQDLTIDSSGVTYNVPYAEDKYYGEVYTKDFHPLATSHWGDVAMISEGEAFAQTVKEILIEEYKANNG